MLVVAVAHPPPCLPGARCALLPCRGAALRRLVSTDAFALTLTLYQVFAANTAALEESTFGSSTQRSVQCLGFRCRQPCHLHCDTLPALSLPALLTRPQTAQHSTRRAI
jgi:hypothetical protein